MSPSGHEDVCVDAKPLPSVVRCTSHHFSESLVLNLLRIDGQEIFKLNTLACDALPQEIGRQITSIAPEVAVIVVLPKGGFLQARDLCGSIRQAGYTGPILIGCFGKYKSFDKMFVRFRKAGATSVTTTYSQLRSKIDWSLKRPPHPAIPRTVESL